MTDTTPGERFAEIRRKNGRMSQSKMADLLGWSPSLQGMIERGEREIEEGDLFKIRQAGFEAIADYIEGKTDEVPILTLGRKRRGLHTTTGDPSPHQEEGNPMEVPKGMAERIVRRDSDMDGAIHEAVGGLVDALNNIEIRIQLNASIVKRLPSVRSERSED